MQVFALLAVLAAAQPIVVTAPPPPTRQQAQEFVHDVTQPSRDQVARYHAPVCPLVVGLEPRASRVVRERIIETVRGVGAEADPSGKCAANLVLVVTEDGRQFVKDLRRKVPDWLGGLGVVDVTTIINDQSPARAWSVVSVRNEDGVSSDIPGYFPKFRPARGAPYTVGGRSDVPTMRVRTASIIKQPTRVDIEGSVIVVDRAAAVGTTLAQLADYAAMRGLARTTAPKSKGVRSILNLFEPGDTHEPELTRSDIIYLQALYRSDGRNGAIQERGRLARAVEADGRSR